MASDRRTCPCGDGERPGHPVGWCRQWDPITCPVIKGDFNGPHLASNKRVFPDPVIIPLDELRRKLAVCSTDVVRDVLAAQGLHVITAEQKAKLDLIEDPLRLLEQLSGELEAKGLRIATRAERAVLDACATWLVYSETLAPTPLNPDGIPVVYWGDPTHIAKAELARRDAEK